LPLLPRFDQLAARIMALPPSAGAVRLVAIDGPAGSGKSTFADRLAAAFGDAPVIHTDDFASWDNQFDWFPRLLSQVIEPIAAGRAGRYRRYDWVARELADWHDVPLVPVVIIEGVGAARREIAAALSFTVWIETPTKLRLARGLERDGDHMRDFWNQWIAGEVGHYATDRTRDRADLIVDGNPSVAHDPDTEFVALS
jgi:uridine kinase